MKYIYTNFTLFYFSNLHICFFLYRHMFMDKAMSQYNTSVEKSLLMCAENQC